MNWQRRAVTEPKIMHVRGRWFGNMGLVGCDNMLVMAPPGVVMNPVVMVMIGDFPVRVGFLATCVAMAYSWWQCGGKHQHC
jgi:hypothetical protein